MKKILIALSVMLTSMLTMAQTVGVDVDRVYNRQLKIYGDAHWMRVNATVDGVNYGLLNRTTKYDTGLGLWNNLEGSVGKTLGAFTPFVAAGYDDGRNGGINKAFWYTRVGVGTGFAMGPGRLNLSVNTRVNFEQSDPKQSIVSVVYSVPVSDKVSVSLRVINSYQTIKEDYRGVGLTYRF